MLAILGNFGGLEMEFKYGYKFYFISGETEIKKFFF